MSKLLVIGFLLPLLCFSTKLSATIVVKDDLGREVNLDGPAKRIVSLAPHITENLFSVGAGASLVGVVDYSDFPEAAKSIPIIGSYKQFNLEAIIASDPDLIVAWHSGNGMNRIQQLVDLGFNVYIVDPKSLEELAAGFVRYGVLTGNEVRGRSLADSFRQTLQELRKNFGERDRVRTFYQVWNEPLQTLNGEHLISKVIELCGGENVFASLPMLAPKLSIESVLQADPQVIIASGMGESRPDWLDDWLAWPSISAVGKKHLYHVHPDIIQRHTLRILEGAQQVCAKIHRARLE